MTKVSPPHIIHQQIARRNLLHRRLLAAERARREAVEDLERFRDETKALYAARRHVVLEQPHEPVA